MSTPSQEPNGKLSRFAIVPAGALSIGTIWGIFNWFNALTADVARHAEKITKLEQASAFSIEDRKDITRQQDENKDALAWLRQSIAEVKAKGDSDAREAQTKLNALRDSTDLRVAEFDRMLSIIWPKEMNPYPGAKATQQRAQD